MIWALIIIYNKYIEKSKTFQSLINNNKNENINFKIIIFDNSNNEYANNNQEYCNNNNIYYYYLNKNVGISKAYNYIIKKLKVKNRKDDYIILLDDDTELPKDYFDELYTTAKTKEYDIILPIVKTNTIIMSPSNTKYDIKYVPINNVNEIKMNKIDAINTGMVVKLSVYDLISYDETLFLDDVDHMFMYNVRKNNFKIVIMKSVINQSFSRNTKNNILSEKKRFKIWIKDHKRYCFKRKKRVFYLLSTVKHRIREFIKYKDFFFLIYRSK